MAPTREDRQADDGRHETPSERLDRNTAELVNELRVAGTGIQVLLAFLLVAPFDARFKTLTAFERDDYYVTLLCLAVAAVLLIAPSVHHRLLFREGQKQFVVDLGTRLAIVASLFIGIGLTGILVLITHMLFGGVPALIVGLLAAIFIAALWFAIPLRHLRHD